MCYQFLVARQHNYIHDGMVDKVSNMKATIPLSVCVCEQRVNHRKCTVCVM